MLALCLLLAGIGVLMAPSAQAAFPGADGVVAVALDGDVWLKIPGGPAEQLTFTGNNLGPRWSADGLRLVFSRDGRIVMLTVSTRAEELVPNIDDARYVNWSADGSHLIFSRGEVGQKTTIWTTRTDGSDQVRIARPGKCSVNGLSVPSWSPDGTKVVFTSGSRSTACTNLGVVARILDLTTRERQRIPYVASDHPTFTSDGSAVIVGVSGPYWAPGYAIERLELASGTVSDIGSRACVEGDGCYSNGNFGVATPGGHVASIITDGNRNDSFPSLICYMSAGSPYDCWSTGSHFVEGDETGFPWPQVRGFDVQPVPATPALHS